MAKSNLLTCLEKRELLNQTAASVDKLLDWGERYEEAGLISDAVDFYEKAGAADRLEALLEPAAAEGNAFLYGRILKALNREASPEAWIALAKKAEELGKIKYAEQAYGKGGMQRIEALPTGQ